jgi:hypothetical protein
MVSRLRVRCPLRPLAILAALSLGSSLALPRAHAVQESTERGTLRVLLIGNSYTRFNQMPRLLERLAADAPFGERLVIDVEARGGSTLRRHYRGGRALALIRTGRYDRVVLQDHSLRTIDRPEEFFTYAGHFREAIAATSARTVLYGTWPRHPSSSLYRKHPAVRSFDQMAERVRGAYRSAAEQLAAGLAPVGSAFERALLEHPTLELYRKDATHPTLAGSFLAACVLYGTLTEGDPRASSYVPFELAADQAALLKAIAAVTLDMAPARPPEPALEPADPVLENKPP